MPHKSTVHAVTAIGIDMGKNTLHMIGLDLRGAIVLREKVLRGRVASRLANLPPCLIGIEAGIATHYVARELAALGHDVKQVPPTYAKPFRQGHKNDFRDAHAVAEAVQRPTTRFVPAKTNEQLDLQALHRVRSRLVSERTAVINQIRGFLLERGIIVRQGLRFLRQQLPDILAKRTDVLSPRMVRIVADLAGDWRQLDERIETVTNEIETLAKSDDNCRRVMTVPGIGPIISSAMVAAIGSGAAFARRAGLFGLARPRAEADVDWRPNHPRAHLQARQRLLAHALHASSPGYSVAAGKLAEAWLRSLAHSCRSAPASERFGRGPC